MVKIAVIDSGIEACENGVTIYEDENGEIIYLDSGYDFDHLIHGDIIAHIIGKENVELYSVKIFHHELYTTAKILCSAIQWCIDKDIKIVNISAGLKCTDEGEVEELRAVCRNAYEKGIIIIAAHDKHYPYPAQFDTVIAVCKNDNLKSSQYQVDKYGIIAANGQAEYISKNSRGGFCGSSFACARITRIISKKVVGKIELNCSDVLEDLVANQNVGLQNSIDLARSGVSGLFFLNNANDIYLRNPDILQYNIKYLYVSDVFYKNDAVYKSDYNIIKFDLDNIIDDRNRLYELFKPVDTVVITRLDFLKKNISDWQCKLEKLIIDLASFEKNVVCFEDVSESALEEISTAFANKNKIVCIESEIRTDKDKNKDIKNIEKTLLLATSRVNDGVLLECSIKNEEGSQCVILSTNFNSKLIGSHVIRRLYDSEYYSYNMRKRLIDANIRHCVDLLPSINRIYMSIVFPIIQYRNNEDRNEKYMKLLSMALAFEADDIKIIVNQQDEVNEVVSTVKMVELLTLRKVREILISDTAYCEGDEGEYTKYASIPSNSNIVKSKIEEIKRLIPDIEINEL